MRLNVFVLRRKSNLMSKLHSNAANSPEKKEFKGVCGRGAPELTVVFVIPHFILVSSLFSLNLTNLAVSRLTVGSL